MPADHHDVRHGGTMKPPRWEVAAGVLAGILGLAGAYATAGWTNALLVVVIDDVVVRLTPGRIVAWTIVRLGESGHLLHYSLSAVIALGLLTGVALIGLRLGAATDTVTFGAVVAAVLSGGVALGLTGAVLPALVTGVAVGIGVAAGRIAVGIRGLDPNADRVRRRLLAMAGGTVVFGALGAVLGSRSDRLPPREATQLGDEQTTESDSLVSRAAETDLGVAGIPGPVSTIEEFYNVDINSATPVGRADEWSMLVTGAVDEPATLSYEELRERDAEHRYVTLRCIGDSLNGDKLDTAVWTGIPVEPLLEQAGPGGEYVTVHAADGYYATYPIEYLDGALLAYGMNGELLPRAHGYPARLLLPGRWGKLNVKWVTEIEVRETKETGWWEQRGWNGESPMNTVAKLWAVNRRADGTVELGGHASAGTRGIERVEVSIDGGDSWTAAELADPLPGEDVARQWRYEFTPERRHEVVVRAIDGRGRVQERDRSEPFPTGATGWVRETVDP